MNNTYIFILISLCLCTLCVLLGIAIFLNNKHKKKLEELTLYQMHITSSIDSSIPEILDLIINESFVDYQIKFLYPLNEGYIKEEREIEIRKDLINLVIQRISSAAMNKISLFYNITNIAEIIADKIYIIVMNYTADHNSKYIE